MFRRQHGLYTVLVEILTHSLDVFCYKNAKKAARVRDGGVFFPGSRCRYFYWVFSYSKRSTDVQH